MELLSKLWVVLTTENEIAIDIISVFLLLIEMPLTMNFFLTALKIPATMKQKHIYLAFTIPIGLLCIFIIPKPYSNIITMLSTPFIIMGVFKVSFFKSVFAELLPVLCITVLEIFITRLIFVFCGINYEHCASIPILRLVTTFFIYAIIYLLYKLFKGKYINIIFSDNIGKKNKLIIFGNLIIALIVLFMQMYLICFYNENLPAFIVWIDIISLISYFVLSFYSIIKTMYLHKAEIDLDQEKQYNKTLQILHDNIRAFKHDFANIISGIGGYIETNDMDGLKKFYKQLLQDCNQVNNLGSLNPDSINSPAVYSVLANKYYKADNLGIKIDLETFIDFNNLYMGIYEFTRILGILLDNAIDAAKECEKKIINVTFRKEMSNDMIIVKIQNTYTNKDVDTEEIYNKGSTSKENHSGLGLWKVRQILMHNNNLNLFTTKDDEFFSQQFEIYK